MADRQVIEWDKDDIDILKFMKVDCLALGMLSCMKRAYSSGSFESTISTMAVTVHAATVAWRHIGIAARNTRRVRRKSDGVEC